MPKELAKTYEAAQFEEKLYEQWERSGFFNPDALPGKRKKPFTIIMPPPNANGSLHAGHALFVTLQDLMTRFRRMQGYRALWLPGADHAGFETQVVYEKKLEEEGRSRLGMDPDQLRKEILSFTLENKSFMEGQLRRLGASCDWSREVFTLDERVVATVYETFRQLDRDGLLYRGRRSVNWCTKHQTSLSDLEQEAIDRTDMLYHIKYGPFVVATVRPETIFGDVAIAVHPKDRRYGKYVGSTVTVETPIGSMELAVIADDAVDMEFGTGALKITPAHDANDFAIAERHGLGAIEVIDQHGILNEKAGKYAGMAIADARKSVVADLEAMGILVKQEEYSHSVPICYKCDTTLEPRILPQWFVRMEPLAKKALKAVEKGKVEIITKKFEKTFYNWMGNINDWNISRQIVWGIPIPAKICTACAHGMVDIENAVTACSACGGSVRKDTDTFDTWFSSGQWPYVTLGYPDGKDYKEHYPTDVMETAGDIIFFWVARMIMLGIYRTCDVPFRKVYLHGLVKDGIGQKMSKSKGNVINPIDLTEKYGTDALRLGLIIGNGPGNDMNLSEDKIEAYKKFANKLWNIARFILLTAEHTDSDTPVEAQTIADQWILARLSETITSVTEDLEQFRFSLAAEKLLTFTWDDFADWYIEISKIEGGKDAILLHILRSVLKLWHPFAPFVTEALWSEIEGESLLIVADWPTPEKKRSIPEDFAVLQQCVTGIRHLKNTYAISPKTIIPVSITTKKNESLFNGHRRIIEALGGVAIEHIGTDIIQDEGPSLRFSLVSKMTGLVTVNLRVEGILDIVKEQNRLKAEIEKLSTYRDALEKKLDNKEFVKNAPATVVEAEKQKLHEVGTKITQYRGQLDSLQ